jgi:hypothetical protein
LPFDGTGRVGADNPNCAKFYPQPVPPPPPAPPAAPSSTVEINPPVISGLNANVASTSVTISWTTNKPATSQLLFGSSTAMSAKVPTDANLTTTHTLQISDLVPGTMYYYEAQSTDPSGKLGNSQQQSFTTTAVTESVPASDTPSTGT